MTVPTTDQGLTAESVTPARKKKKTTFSETQWNRPRTLRLGPTPVNENQIMICLVSTKTTVITRKILILTFLGGQAIFIADGATTYTP